MTKYSRIISLVTALSLIGVIFLPLWSIELTAPQYPEGLTLKIYSDKLGGDVEVVNGLNHYIGMRTLHEKDFPEFLVLPYIIGTLVCFGLLSFAFNRRWFFLAWVAFYMIFAVTAMLDFYRWEYNYGHNLDPTAPIQVPGMAYQPPLIGFKQLLNFGVYSIPDTGGIIFIGVALLLLAAAFLEWKDFRKKYTTPASAAILLIMGLTLFSSCGAGPKPIRLGRESCHFCKMTISDAHFGGEIITRKGKIFYFDDSHCLVAFLQSNSMEATQIQDIYLMDYSRPNELLPASKSFLLESESLRSPMGGNVAAFSEEDSMKKYAAKFPGTIITWPDLLNKKG